MFRRNSLIYIVILVFSILAPLFLSSIYLRELLVMTCIYAILALSLDIITGYMGQLSFGHSAFFGIGAYVAALLPLRLGISNWLAFVGATALPAIFGLIIGYISLKRTRGMYLAIVTFGFGWVLYVIASNWFSLTRGPTGLFNIPALVIDLPFLPEFKIYSNLSYYYFSLAMLVIVFYFMSRLIKARFGRALVTLRENEDLGRSIGINPMKYYVIAFTISTGLAGFGGALYTYHMRTISPQLLGMQYMFTMIIMVIIGGMGTKGGPIFGAIIYIWGSELLRFGGGLRFFFFGAIIIVFIIFMPEGVYPKLVSLKESIDRYFKKKMVWK